jgi:hypothetical protein
MKNTTSPKVDTPAEKLIAAERARQQTVEGWTAEHDDKHDRGELGIAALSYYAASPLGYQTRGDPPVIWPWAKSWFKPAGHVGNCIKAGALIRAERDRLDRLEAEVTSTLDGLLAAGHQPENLNLGVTAQI